MMGEQNVVHLDASQAALRQAFLKWQCLIRKAAMRHDDGRPQDGMRPYVRLPDDEAARARIVTVLNPREPEWITSEFKHMMKKYMDPRERFENAVKKMAAEYYEEPDEFSDRVTALFGAGVPLVDELAGRGECILDFEHQNRSYTIPCTVTELRADDPDYQATYWHNSLFNPNMRPGVRVLRFAPVWARAQADPPPQ